MAGVRFCTKCAFRPVSEPGSPTSAGLYCSRCSPRSRKARVGLATIAILCAGIGFAAGRYTTAREPFYIIGTPIQVDAKGVALPRQSQSLLVDAQGTTQPRTETASSSTTTVCGARTKSGKTCQRKVKGGGFCWQHRNNHPNVPTGIASH